jgi:hypothetical protein
MVASIVKAGSLPQWAQRVVTDLSGREPLGLSRVSLLLTDHLLPGIITTTDRARYYALYCWILWHIQQEDRPASRETFICAFQRREAAIALATLLMDADASPVGKRAASRQLAQGGNQGEVSTAFPVLPANALGGFGQYYAGCLYQLGLTHRLDDGIDRVTEGMAEQLARTVHRSLDQTPYLRSRLFAQSTVNLQTLAASSERLGINAITQPFADDERTLLLDLFFGFNEEHASDATHRRCHSLTRILVLLAAYEHADIVVEEASLPAQLVYGPAYFGVLVDAQDGATPFIAPASLQRCSDFWRQFCLHQFLTQALEGLLDAVLQALTTRSEGLPLGSLVSSLLDRDFIPYLEQAVEAGCRTPSALLHALRTVKVPSEMSCFRLRDCYPYDHVLSEWWMWQREAATPAALAARSCLLLAILYGKWRGVVSDVTYAVVAERAGAELAAPTVLPLLDTWLETDWSWDSALCDLLLLLSRQHDHVMYGKGRLESCWLHLEDDRYVYDQAYTASLRASRHEQAVQILADLGLLQWTTAHSGRGDRQLMLTEQGCHVIERVRAED